MRTSLLLTLSCALAPLAAFATPKVSEVHPPHWWTGMNSPSLQLQIHGEDIRDADFNVSWPGVSVDSVVRLDASPNWQYIYLTIAPEAQPGVMTLEWDANGKKVSYPYELRARKPQKGAQGFSAADVLYLVMPDRFANGDTGNDVVATMRNPAFVDRNNPNVRHGGDFEGINQHLDYIDSLGVTAVWFNPVLENDMPEGSYHGYATTDYYKVDPRFGSNEEYIALVEALHGRGIKTVMDMIFNHSGSDHPWALDPPASDWFNHQEGFYPTNHKLSANTDPYASDYDLDAAVNGWFVPEMPDLNQRNPHLWKYLVQNSIWWIEESQIDGIRQDTYPYVEPEVMATWTDAVLAEYPDFDIVGECWFSHPAAVSFWQTGSPVAQKMGRDTHLQTVMDFPLMIKMKDMAPLREETTAWTGLNTIYDHLSLDFIYADPMRVLRFLDNHDTERFIQSPVDDLAQWKQAITLLLTLPGIPQIYYGTELLMNGTREGGDGNVRRDIPGGFPGDTQDWFTAEGRSALQNEAYDFIATINNWRKGSTAAAQGKMKHFMTDTGLYVYQRKAGDDAFIVVLNGTDRENEVDMARYAEIAAPGETFTDILTGEEFVLIPSHGAKTFAPRETRILQKK